MLSCFNFTKETHYDIQKIIISDFFKISKYNLPICTTIWQKGHVLLRIVIFSKEYYWIKYYFFLFLDVLPCFGDLPVVDKSSGLEYNCGLYGAECPQNSFCHQTSHFAKCCPKGNVPFFSFIFCKHDDVFRHVYTMERLQLSENIAKHNM